MSTYAIGDVQGCLQPLQRLLDHIQFDVAKDILWFTGDLVNRGPQSLEVLRLIKALGPQHKIVLGNHDLHLLAVYHHVEKKKMQDTFDEILSAADVVELINWLQHQPLLCADNKLNYVMTHAGLPPAWTLSKAQQLAGEVENILRGDQVKEFLQQMHGNFPDQWRDDLTGFDRIRCIINYFTRMRYCYADGGLDFSYKGRLGGEPAGLLPWFSLPNRVNQEVKIIFGHWAALNGEVSVNNIFPLDTGCVWGNCLTALRLEDQKRFSVKCE